MLGKGTFVIDLDFKPRGVCARMIHVELSDDGSTIENVAFDGGCNGNLKAIGRLARRPTGRFHRRAFAGKHLRAA